MTRSSSNRPVTKPSSGSRAPGDGTGAGEEIVLRHLETHEDFEACVALQKEVWGERFEDVTPPALLKIVGRVGGVAAGAFSSDGRLEGFVFGISGVVDGRPVHWSHMLAVRSELRSRGVGVRLKLFQRQTLLEHGIGTVLWTFDPLVARNAHVNLNRLGARIDRYVRDFYGSGEDSELSAGIGTDRFVVRWELAEERVERAIADRGALAADTAEAWASAPVVNVRERAGGRGGFEPVEVDLPEEEGREPSRVRVEVPLDIQAVRAENRVVAATWRASTRRALERALARGFEVDLLSRSPDGRRAFYLLRREGS